MAAKHGAHSRLNIRKQKAASWPWPPLDASNAASTGDSASAFSSSVMSSSSTMPAAASSPSSSTTP